MDNCSPKSTMTIDEAINKALFNQNREQDDVHDEAIADAERHGRTSGTTYTPEDEPASSSEDEPGTSSRDRDGTNVDDPSARDITSNGTNLPVTSDGKNDPISGGRNDPSSSGAKNDSSCKNDRRRSQFILSMLKRMEVDALSFEDLVLKLKEFQRVHPEARTAWIHYTTYLANGLRDPKKHSIQFLRNFFKTVQNGDLKSYVRMKNPHRGGDANEVFVGGIGVISSDRVFHYFEGWGKLRYVDIRDEKGFAFVKFQRREDMIACLKAQHYIDGKHIEVKLAENRTPKTKAAQLNAGAGHNLSGALTPATLGGGLGNGPSLNAVNHQFNLLSANLVANLGSATASGMTQPSMGMPNSMVNQQNGMVNHPLFGQGAQPFANANVMRQAQQHAQHQVQQQAQQQTPGYWNQDLMASLVYLYGLDWNSLWDFSNANQGFSVGNPNHLPNPASYFPPGFTAPGLTAAAFTATGGYNCNSGFTSLTANGTFATNGSLMNGTFASTGGAHGPSGGAFAQGLNYNPAVAMASAEMNYTSNTAAASAQGNVPPNMNGDFIRNASVALSATTSATAGINATGGKKGSGKKGGSNTAANPLSNTATNPLSNQVNITSCEDGVTKTDSMSTKATFSSLASSTGANVSPGSTNEFSKEVIAPAPGLSPVLPDNMLLSSPPSCPQTGKYVKFGATSWNNSGALSHPQPEKLKKRKYGNLSGAYPRGANKNTSIVIEKGSSEKPRSNNSTNNTSTVKGTTAFSDKNTNGLSSNVATTSSSHERSTTTGSHERNSHEHPSHDEYVEHIIHRNSSPGQLEQHRNSCGSSGTEASGILSGTFAKTDGADDGYDVLHDDGYDGYNEVHEGDHEGFGFYQHRNYSVSGILPWHENIAEPSIAEERRFTAPGATYHTNGWGKDVGSEEWGSRPEEEDEHAEWKSKDSLKEHKHTDGKWENGLDAHSRRSEPIDVHRNHFQRDSSCTTHDDVRNSHYTTDSHHESNRNSYRSNYRNSYSYSSHYEQLQHDDAHPSRNSYSSSNSNRNSHSNQNSYKSNVPLPNALSAGSALSGGRPISDIMGSPLDGGHPSGGAWDYNGYIIPCASPTGYEAVASPLGVEYNTSPVWGVGGKGTRTLQDWNKDQVPKQTQEWNEEWDYTTQNEWKNEDWNSQWENKSSGWPTNGSSTKSTEWGNKFSDRSGEPWGKLSWESWETHDKKIRNTNTDGKKTEQQRSFDKNWRTSGNISSANETPSKVSAKVLRLM